MNCSKGCAGTYCPCQYAHWLPRIAFGLILVGFGVNHYRHLKGFMEMSSGPFSSIPTLASFAAVLSYLVPALMIIGGVLFAVKQLGCVSKTCILASLSGIIGWASVAVLIGDAQSAGVFMPLIQNAGLLLILYWVVKKMSCCGSCSITTTGAPMMK